MVAFMADRQKPSKPSGTVRKATSSPSVRAIADGETEDLSSADKKRNKLGYHRTAVACGHCRRRKIRCIPSADTSSTRCQNCIRLKKDCQFYPVEQSGTTQPKRSRAESKGDQLTNGSETSVSSSSPRAQTGAPLMDQFDHYRAPMDTPVITQGPDHDYAQSYDRPWFPNVPSQHPYWLQNDSQHPDAFVPSPYPITPTTTVQSSITSHEHAYTYPSLSLEHQAFPYSTQRPRTDPLSPQNGTITSFGGFRANTMPDRIGVSEEPQHGHNVLQTTMSMPSQHLMGPPYQSMNRSPPQYVPPLAHQPWLPANSEAQHHAATYMPTGPSSTWYNHTNGTIGVRDEIISHKQPREAITQESKRFRTNPG